MINDIYVILFPFQSDFRKVKHNQTKISPKQWSAQETKMFIWLATQAPESNHFRNLSMTIHEKVLYKDDKRTYEA